VSQLTLAHGALGIGALRSAYPERQSGIVTIATSDRSKIGASNSKRVQSSSLIRSKPQPLRYITS
jgi:hypothetical protein